MWKKSKIFINRLNNSVVCQYNEILLMKQEESKKGKYEVRITVLNNGMVTKDTKYNLTIE